jgi:hypothetical protein
MTVKKPAAGTVAPEGVSEMTSSSLSDVAPEAVSRRVGANLDPWLNLSGC